MNWWSSRATSRRTDSRTRCCSGWAARASPRRCSGGPSERQPRRSICTCSTRPIRTRSSKFRTRSTSSTRCSSSRPSRAARSRPCRCSSTSTRSRPTASNSSPSPILAARSSSLLRSTASGRCFENDPNIGGRYSALSLFGLVPAALIGAPVHALLERAVVAEQACAHFDSTAIEPRSVARARDRRARAPAAATS